jgi:RNA polymerase sigma-70 factor (ECF subfamily)
VQAGGFFRVKFRGELAAGLLSNSAVEVPDKELIAEVLAGQAESFEPLVVKYQPRVFALARRYARREDEVADIAQTVFIKAFQKLSSYRGDAPFEHWLMRMATFTCYDFLRKHQRNREYHASDLSDEENDWLENVGEELTGETDRNAAKALVERLLEGLKPEDRHIIVLLEMEGKSVKEIAEITELSESNVKVKAHRARDKMRKLLAGITPEKYL